MTATVDELRFELVAKIARPRLLEIRERYPESFLAHAEAEGVPSWRQVFYAECDAALDEADDAAAVAILHHSLA